MPRSRSASPKRKKADGPLNCTVSVDVRINGVHRVPGCDKLIPSSQLKKAVRKYIEQTEAERQGRCERVKEIVKQRMPSSLDVEVVQQGCIFHGESPDPGYVELDSSMAGRVFVQILVTLPADEEEAEDDEWAGLSLDFNALQHYPEAVQLNQCDYTGEPEFNIGASNIDELPLSRAGLRALVQECFLVLLGPVQAELALQCFEDSIIEFEDCAFASDTIN